jgi:hypothetical protein
MSIYGNEAKIIDEKNVILELDPLVKSMVTTSTFHHLGHEGMVFIHSKRHSAIAAGANLDILVRVPAGNANRQVHMRYLFTGVVNGASVLDIDISLYKEPTITADGTAEAIASTNDALVKSTGVLMFSGSTVTDVGLLKTTGMIVGEKRSASSKEQAVPEWILAPNGVSARDYLFRVTNNTADTVDVNGALFFFDSEAV